MDTKGKIWTSAICYQAFNKPPTNAVFGEQLSNCWLVEWRHLHKINQSVCVPWPQHFQVIRQCKIEQGNHVWKHYLGASQPCSDMHNGTNGMGIWHICSNYIFDFMITKPGETSSLFPSDLDKPGFNKSMPEKQADLLQLELSNGWGRAGTKWSSSKAA